jgi:hypothetical protein
VYLYIKKKKEDKNPLKNTRYKINNNVLPFELKQRDPHSYGYAGPATD